mgnify:CR=1 FL=1
MEKIKYFWIVNKRVILSVISVVTILVIAGSAFYFVLNRNKSLESKKVGAASQSCYLELSLDQPTPTPTPIVTPTPIRDMSCQVGGKKFEDKNSDRLFNVPPDGYGNVTNWAFNLYRRNSDGTRTQLAQTTTTANGSWLNWPNSFKFSNLDCSSSYIIKEQFKTGWHASGDKAEGVRDSYTTWANPRIGINEGSEAWFHFNSSRQIIVDTNDQYNGRMLIGFHFGSVKNTFTPTPIGIATPTATPQIPIINLVSIADTYVVSGSTTNTKNYGGEAKLSVDGSPVSLSYLKFDLTSLTSKTITNAILRLNISDSSSGTQKIYTTNDAWTETTLNYNNRPLIGTLMIASFVGSGSVGINKDIDITSFVKANLGKVVTLVVNSTSSDGFDFKSRESSSGKPTIIVK